MSLESRMFSSGSQVLYLPSHTRKTRMRTGEAAAHARGSRERPAPPEERPGGPRRPSPRAPGPATLT